MSERAGRRSVELTCQARGVSQREVTINFSDETFIVAEPVVVARIVAQPDRWAVWWPSLTLQVYEDRGVKGIRWTVTGELVGTAELWVEPQLDGVVLHHFLRVDPTEPGAPTIARTGFSSPRGRRRVAAIERRYALSWKQHVWRLKDELEGARRVGEPR